jgi:hypothetical protein
VRQLGGGGVVKGDNKRKRKGMKMEKKNGRQNKEK